MIVIFNMTNIFLLLMIYQMGIGLTYPTTTLNRSKSLGLTSFSQLYGLYLLGQYGNSRI